MCNLGSINLVKHLQKTGNIDHKKLEQTILFFHGERVLRSWQLFEILGEIQILVRISLQRQFQHKA